MGLLQIVTPDPVSILVEIVETHHLPRNGDVANACHLRDPPGRHPRPRTLGVEPEFNLVDGELPFIQYLRFSFHATEGYSSAQADSEFVKHLYMCNFEPTHWVSALFIGRALAPALFLLGFRATRDSPTCQIRCTFWIVDMASVRRSAHACRQTP